MRVFAACRPPDPRPAPRGAARRGVGVRAARRRGGARGRRADLPGLDRTPPDRPPGDGAPLGGGQPARRQRSRSTPPSGPGGGRRARSTGCAPAPSTWSRRSPRRPRTCARSSSSTTPRGPLDFWARRQCHETTIHAVDALAGEPRPLPPRGRHLDRPRGRRRRHRRAARRVHDPQQEPAAPRGADDHRRAGRRVAHRLAGRDQRRPAVVTVAPREEVADAGRRTPGRAGRRRLPHAVEPVRRAGRRRTRR